MNLTLAGVLLTPVFGTGTWAAGQQVASSGPSLEGIAALIAALTGLITAIGAFVLGLRTKQDNKAEARAEVLEELLIKQLQKEAEDEK